MPTAILASAGSTSGTFVSPLSGSNLWTTETLLFTANSSSTVITLTGLNLPLLGGGIPPGHLVYLGLDNVDVTATPLPAALPLFAGGLGLMGLFARYRKRKVAASVST